MIPTITGTNQFGLVLVYRCGAPLGGLQLSSFSYDSSLFSGSANLSRLCLKAALPSEDHHGVELIRHRRAQMGSDDVHGATKTLL